MTTSREEVDAYVRRLYGDERPMPESWVPRADFEAMKAVADETLRRGAAMLLAFAALQKWKDEAMATMPDYQAIGRELGLEIGDSVHDKILPAIRALKDQESGTDVPIKPCREPGCVRIAGHPNYHVGSGPGRSTKWQ